MQKSRYLKFTSVLRSGTASRRSAGTQRLHLVQPVWRPNLDASDSHGPQRTPQWHTAYRGTLVNTNGLLGTISVIIRVNTCVSVWFRWPWKRLCLISAALITTTGWNTSSSSRTTSSWCSQTSSCHPATMHRRVWNEACRFNIISFTFLNIGMTQKSILKNNFGPHWLLLELSQSELSV